MKSTIVSMFIVLIVLMIVPMFLLNNEEYLQKLGFGGDSNMEDLKAKAPKNIETVTTDRRVEVYKWVDDSGVVQFTNTPPMEGRASEKIVLSPNTNVMDAIKIPEEEPEVASGPTVYTLGNPYTPGGAKELIDQSMKLQEQMNQQQVEQEKMMQDMMKGVFNQKK